MIAQIENRTAVLPVESPHQIGKRYIHNGLVDDLTIGQRLLIRFRGLEGRKRREKDIHDVMNMSVEVSTVYSWGAKYYKVLADGLTFRVYGTTFQGWVQIAYNPNSRLYTVFYGHAKKNKWILCHVNQNVAENNLIKTIDAVVESVY